MYVDNMSIHTDPITGKLLPGNSAWRSRAKHGVDKIFRTPADLWAACIEYFEWAEENPLYAVETVKYMGTATLQPVPKLRMLTIKSMCIFLGTPQATWYNYRKYPGYEDTCAQVEAIIYEQKLNGAAADLLNSNIISRHLGLSDNQNINQSGSINTEWKVTIVSPGDVKDET
jgi:hypothetical protein